MSKAAYAAAVFALVLGWALLFGFCFSLVTQGICPEFAPESQAAALEAGLTPLASPWGIGDGIAIGSTVAVVCASAAALGPLPLLPFRRIVASTVGMLVAVVVVTAVVFGISFLSYELMVLANPNQSHELRALGVAHEWAAVIALVLGLVEGFWILGTRKKLDPSLPA